MCLLFSVVVVLFALGLVLSVTVSSRNLIAGRGYLPHAGSYTIVYSECIPKVRSVLSYIVSESHITVNNANGILIDSLKIVKPELGVSALEYEINRLDKLHMIIRGKSKMPHEKNIFDILVPVKVEPSENAPNISIQLITILIVNANIYE